MNALLLAALLAAPSAARPAEEAAVEKDLALVLASAGLPPKAVSFARGPSKDGRSAVSFACGGGELRVVVSAPDEEWGPAFYHGLHSLGFSWPHPRRQLSPDLKALRSHCGGRAAWKPRLAKRGFHLHTQHPSEWVYGFVAGKGSIAEETVRWAARNRQNLLQVKALRDVEPKNMAPAFALAQSLGLETGLDVSLASLQQKGYRLLDGFWPLWGAVYAPWGARHVKKSVLRLCDDVPFDYLSVELGSSEFTPTPKAATLSWLEAARDAAGSRSRAIFTKVHVSSGQGRFNFLPAEADPSVGVQVHTVMPFGLEGPAPVYGRDDFADLKAFMLEQKDKRPTWYFPETSYFLGIDIDLPLLLTDYLLARSNDMDLLEKEKVEGQVDFTTGQELGCWLLDWNVALLADGSEKNGPLAALLRLGEDKKAWQAQLEYQHRFFVEEGALSMLTAASLLDELPLQKEHRLLRRKLLRELGKDPAALSHETVVLERAAAAIPPTTGVKDAELRALLDVTYGRVRHALALRRALAHPRGSAERKAFLAEAAAEREKARALLKPVVAAGRYPEARLFEKRDDPTSYDYGYGWPAASLYFWEREERIVAEGRVSPFFDQIYSVPAILF